MTFIKAIVGLAIGFSLVFCNFIILMAGIGVLYGPQSSAIGILMIVMAIYFGAHGTNLLAFVIRSILDG